jgi:hypothetical protein
VSAARLAFLVYVGLMLGLVTLVLRDVVLAPMSSLLP